MAAKSALRQNSRVLISGASVAGPALALWLDRYGFDVTVVEKADGVRRGGQAVDFKGATHMNVRYHCTTVINSGRERPNS